MRMQCCGRGWDTWSRAAMCGGTGAWRESCVRGPQRNELHRRAEHPRRELRRAEVELLALGALAGRHAQHQLENALAALLHGFLAVEDAAAVHVHVVFHACIHWCIRGEL